MTIHTSATYEPIMIDFEKGLDRFAQWRHPNNEAAQTACKYNTIATVANTALVTTIASFAIACFTNFIVLGLVLTAASGIIHLAFSEIAEEIADKKLAVSTDYPWKPVLLKIAGIPSIDSIDVFRCYSVPKGDAPKTGDQVPAK